MSVNCCVIQGNLTRDAESRHTSNGQMVCNFRIAINEGYGDNKKTTFVNVACFGKVAEACATHLKKGDMVIIESRLTIDEWEKDGQRQSQPKLVAHRVEFVKTGNRKDENDY